MAFAQSKSSQQQALEKQIAKYCQAMGKKDIRGVQAVMRPDYVSISKSRQTQDLKTSLAAISDLFAQAKRVAITCTIKSFKMEKGNAHIQSHNVLEYDLPAAGGKIAKVRDVSTSDEIWSPTNGTFKIKIAKEVAHSLTVNGKPAGG